MLQVFGGLSMIGGFLILAKAIKVPDDVAGTLLMVLFFGGIGLISLGSIINVGLPHRSKGLLRNKPRRPVPQRAYPTQPAQRVSRGRLPQHIADQFDEDFD